MQADEVCPEDPLQDLASPGQLHEQLSGRERDVQEEPDAHVGPQLTEHARNELQLVVVDPHRRARGRSIGRRSCIAFVHRSVRVPPRSFERRRADGVVVQRPQRRVGETEIELVVLLLRDPNRAEFDSFVRARDLGVAGVSRPPDPDAAALTEHRYQRGHQATRTQRPRRAAAVQAPDRQSVCHDDQVCGRRRVGHGVDGNRARRMPRSRSDFEAARTTYPGIVSLSTRPLLQFESSFARELAGLCVPWSAAPAPAPQLIALNEGLAHELGVDPATLRSPDGVAVLVGDAELEGGLPVAQAYAGHQFGFLSPRLGDGRALLLGEVLDTGGCRRDVHLKGSGRTPFARGGDGKAVLGPMLRELLIGEALHSLGIPTTRALAVVATGEQVMREGPQPGAVLVRVAASHLRVGTFQYAAMSTDPTLLRRLADYAIARHYPDASQTKNPYLALLDDVVDAQASLVARWMLVGFVHGVMNTDNMTISGESIDFGPCAFMDAFDPSTVFSSIDDAGRYAYGNQPQIALWNLARLAEALLPLLHVDVESGKTMATEVLQSFSGRYHEAWTNGMRAKLGLGDDGGDVGEMIDELLGVLREQNVDFTAFFRALSSAVLGNTAPARSLFRDPASFDEWAAGWHAEMARQSLDLSATALAMDQVNPVYIPRNHKVEHALTAATGGDLEPFRRLLEAITRPFVDRPGFESYAVPPPPGTPRYRTFCGT